MAIDLTMKMTTRDVAGLLKLTQVRVRQLVAEGRLRREPNGRFTLGHVFEDWTAEYERRIEQARAQTPHQIADTALKEAQTQLKQLELATRRGKLIHADVHLQATLEIVTAQKQNLLALPGRAAPQLANVTEREAFVILQEAVIEIQQGIHDGLAKLADVFGERAEAARKEDQNAQANKS